MAMEIMKSKRLRRSIDWSSLPDLALYSILGRLDTMEAFCSFRRVCTTWRAVATLSSDSLSSQSPLLVLTRNDDLRQQFYDTSNDGFYRTRRLLPWRVNYWRAISYSHGYLVTVDVNKDIKITLHNLFTKAQFRVPLIPDSKHWIHIFGRVDASVLLSGPPTDERTFVVAFCPDNFYLGLCQLKYPTWRVHDFHNLIQDIIFFKGKLFAITRDFQLISMDLESNNLEFKFIKEGYDAAMVKVDRERDARNDWTLGKSDEDLLLVCYSVTFDNKILVFKWAFEEKRWVKATSIGGKALFIGTYGFGACVEPNKVNFKENCIYYADTKSRNLFEYSLPDGCLVVLKHFSSKPPSIWVLPGRM